MKKIIIWKISLNFHRCVVPGHVLVAPKRVAKRAPDLTPEEAADFFQTVIKVQKVFYKNINIYFVKIF